MLGNSPLYPCVAVKDLAAGKEFYGGKLGLESEDTKHAEGVFFKSGGSKFFVYQSQYAGTNQATAMSWEVSDVKAVVDELTAKGITFENYDIPNATRDGAVHIIGSLHSAWFKDPDGNILNIVSN